MSEESALGARLAHPAPGRAVPLAAGRRRQPPAGGGGAGRAGARQARDRGDAGAVQGGGRRAGARGRRVGGLVPGGRAGGADARLRAAAPRRRRLHPAPRRHLRPGRPAGAAADGDRDLPARARARAALPPRAADRRAQPDHRPRRQGRRRAAALPAVLGGADAARAAAGRRDPLGGVRRLVPRRGRRDGRGLRLVHLPDDRVAGAGAGADERARHRRQPEGGRQPAELRDRQILQRRGARDRRATTSRSSGYERRRPRPARASPG